MYEVESEQDVTADDAQSPPRQRYVYRDQDGVEHCSMCGMTSDECQHQPASAH